jgi:FtsZ-interacting cell division protein ZipA
MTWGLFVYGIWAPKSFTYFSIAIFIYAIIVLVGMLISGSRANTKNHFSVFLASKISAKKAAVEEEHNRAKQEKEYAERLAERNKVQA